MTGHRIVKAFLAVIFTCVLCEDTFDQDLYKLANSIAGKYFTAYPCVTHITEKTDIRLVLKNHQMTFNVNLSKIPKCSNWDDDCSAELVNLLWESYFQGCAGYVIQVESSHRSRLVKTLLKAYNKTPRNRYNNKRYLFLPVDEFDNDMDIVDSPDMFFMPNMLLVTCNVSSSVPKYNFSIYTHNTFHGYKYDVLGVKHEVVTTWSSVDGFSNNEDLYPDKMGNLHGKKLIFSLIHYIPYTIVEEGDETKYDGLETRIAVEFTKLVNASWEAKVFSDMWGALFENGTGNGILGAALEHRADMGFAAVYQWKCEIVFCSYPYVYAAVTCMVPRPQLVSGWLTIILSFTSDTWYSLMVAYVISSCFVSYLYTQLEKRNKKKKFPGYGSIIFESFYITFRLQLEQIPRIVYKNTALSAYTRWLTIYYFFVAVFWAGGIASILTIPRYEKPINEVEDLVERYPEIEWGANHDVWVMPIEQSQIPNQKFMSQTFVVLDDDALVRRAKEGTFAFFMERLPNGHYGFNDYINEDTMPYLKIMEGDVHTANCVIVSPKGWPLMERLDRMLILMFETGIIQKLEHQVSLEKINNRLQEMIRLSTEKPADEMTPLQMRHIEGPLFLWTMGVVCSIVAFCVEIFIGLANKKLKKRNRAVKRAFTMEPSIRILIHEELRRR